MTHNNVTQPSNSFLLCSSGDCKKKRDNGVQNHHQTHSIVFQWYNVPLKVHNDVIEPSNSVLFYSSGDCKKEKTQWSINGIIKLVTIILQWCL